MVDLVFKKNVAKVERGEKSYAHASNFALLDCNVPMKCHRKSSGNCTQSGLFNEWWKKKK